MKRCDWVSDDPIYLDYHDRVWGRPVVDPKELFAKLCLDGQQAGLSWLTILKKQDNYLDAFAGLDPVPIAAFTDADVERLMLNKGIVRNRLKIQSIIRNAKAYLALDREGVNFSDFLWGFVDGKTVINRWQNIDQVPVTTPESDEMSKALKKVGFNFVGSTIVYAFMQAVGMVNDHTTDCHCYQACVDAARR